MPAQPSRLPQPRLDDLLIAGAAVPMFRNGGAYFYGVTVNFADLRLTELGPTIT
jgi:hypothetical protein